MLARLRSPMALSLADQMLVSAANLALSFWLISHWAPATFGLFALVISISLTGLALHQALTGAQLPLLRARATSAMERSEVLASAWLTALVIAFVIATATALGFWLLGKGDGPGTALAAGFFVGLHVVREHVRTYHFAELEVGQALANDAVHALVVLVGLVATSLLAMAIEPNLVFGLMAAGSIVAIAPSLLSRPADFALRADRAVRHRIALVWHQHARWALMGATASEMQTRGHVLAVGTFFGMAELGAIQAALLLMRPVGLLSMAWGRVARPVMARLFAQDQAKAAARHADRGALALAAVMLLYLAALWLAWPLLRQHVIPAAYDGLQLAVAFWGIATLLGILRAVYSLEAQCVPMFREAFFASAVAMIVVLAGLALAVLAGSATSSILAVAAGEAASLMVLLVILHREVSRRPERSTPAVAN